MPVLSPTHVGNNSISIGALVARLKAASFQGRDPEIRRFAELVRKPDLLPRVLCVTGPPGIGKSALMEAVRDRLQSARLAEVVIVHMHDFDRSPEGLERILVESTMLWPRRPGDPPLVLVLDGYERVSMAERRHLREKFTAKLMGPILVAFCERRPPADLLVAQVGWRSVTEEMALGPLTVVDSTALLEAHGVIGGASRSLALEAMGNPLLTAVAAEVALHEPDPERWGSRVAEETTRLLANRLQQEGLDAHGFALVEAASLATSVNQEVLAALLRRDIVDHFPRFTALSIVIERASGDYAVVEPFRSLVARDVRRRRPHGYERMKAELTRAAVVPSALPNAPTRPSRELLLDVKAALEWLRHGRTNEPCRLASRLEFVGADGEARLRRMLTRVIGSLVESRSPRVAEASRLLMYYYFDRAASLEAVAERMNISRATAFRRLRLGIELVAEGLPIG